MHIHMCMHSRDSFQSFFFRVTRTYRSFFFFSSRVKMHAPVSRANHEVMPARRQAPHRRRHVTRALHHALQHPRRLPRTVEHAVAPHRHSPVAQARDQGQRRPSRTPRQSQRQTCMQMKEAGRRLETARGPKGRAEKQGITKDTRARGVPSRRRPSLPATTSCADTISDFTAHPGK